MKTFTAVIHADAPEFAAHIERHSSGAVPVLVIEDATDRVAILLTGEIAQRIVDALVGHDVVTSGDVG